MRENTNLCNQTTSEAQRPMTADEILAELFTYHAPRPDQLPRYDQVRRAAKFFAETVLINTPRCADQSAAIRHIREAVMTANAAIALDGLDLRRAV